MATFNDLEFKRHPSTYKGWAAQHKFDNGFTLSVVAGEYFYRTPKIALNEADKYSAFEIAILDGDDNFATEKIIPNVTDDVIGWKTREEITAIMEQIEKTEV